MDTKIVNCYDVELTCVPKDRAGPAESVTRTEYAYNIPDAIVQAMMNTSVEYPTDRYTINLLRVGPTAEAVRAATVGLRAFVDGVLAQVLKKK